MWKNKVISALATSTCSSSHSDVGGSIYSQPINIKKHNDKYRPRKASSHTGLLVADNPGNVNRQYHTAGLVDNPDDMSDHNPHFIPVNCHVYCLIGFLVTALCINQFIMCASLHTNDDTVAVRVLLIPLIYYFLIISISLYLYFTDLHLFLNAGYFAFCNELEENIKIPCMIHSIVFAVVGVIIACSTTEHDSSSLMYISANVREIFCVILWSITHVVELMYW
eukprot:UN34065